MGKLSFTRCVALVAAAIFASVWVTACSSLYASVSLHGDGGLGVPAGNSTVTAPRPPVQPQTSSPGNTVEMPESPPQAPEQSLKEVPYKGPVYHLFFHPLIAFPEKAFDGDNRQQFMDDWFVTAGEFKSMLDQLYRNGYTLVNIQDAYENHGKTLTKKDFLLPEGKKPLILSIDDVNYYKYMKENGTVHRLMLDERGELCTYTQFDGQPPFISRDQELMPILEEFLKVHPDFSTRGARGIIAVTGYNGLFGYPTDEPSSPTYEQDLAAVRKIAEKLKQLGWQFASHGYYHLDTPRAPLEKVKKDTARWRKEVEPVIGPTDLYIYPLGSALKPSDPRFDHLLENGFTVFFSVGTGTSINVSDRYVTMDRWHIDGKFFTGKHSAAFTPFDAGSLMDPARKGPGR